MRIFYTDLVGPNNTVIKIQLGDDPNNRIDAKINRTANKNGTPRIMGGKQMKEWIKNNYRQNEVMIVEIINPHFLKIHPKSSH